MKTKQQNEKKDSTCAVKRNHGPDSQVYKHSEKQLYREDGTPANLSDIVTWWLENYEGMEHMTEGGRTSPESWYTINTILRRCLTKVRDGKN
jgi:hypothetical protein